MPTKKPRVTFTLDEKQLNRIDNYRFNYKLKNQTQAILSLIENGLDALSDNSYEPEFQKSEIEYIKKYRALDAHGKEMVDFVLEKEYSRCENAASAHLMPVAAHGDGDDDEQVRLMQEDADEL